MPLYEYQCTKCHRRTEKIEKVSGPHLKKCPHCGARVEPMISAPAIQFKGSGWYVTDYAGKKSETSAKETSDSKDAASDAAKAGAGKDSSSKETSAKEVPSKESPTKESSAKESKEKKSTKKKD